LEKETLYKRIEGYDSIAVTVDELDGNVIELLELIMSKDIVGI
jgi:hypothetical protein